MKYLVCLTALMLLALPAGACHPTVGLSYGAAYGNPVLGAPLVDPSLQLQLQYQAALQAVQYNATLQSTQAYAGIPGPAYGGNFGLYGGAVAAPVLVPVGRAVFFRGRPFLPLRVGLPFPVRRAFFPSRRGF